MQLQQRLRAYYNPNGGGAATRQLMDEAADALDQAVEALTEAREELQRSKEHLASWAHEYSEDATTETWAILHCAEQSIAKIDATLASLKGTAPVDLKAEITALKGRITQEEIDAAKQWGADMAASINVDQGTAKP